MNLRSCVHLLLRCRLLAKKQGRDLNQALPPETPDMRIAGNFFVSEVNVVFSQPVCELLVCYDQAVVQSAGKIEEPQFSVYRLTQVRHVLRYCLEVQIELRYLRPGNFAGRRRFRGQPSSGPYDDRTTKGSDPRELIRIIETYEYRLRAAHR